MWHRLKGSLIRWWRTADAVNRHRAADILSFEVEELEHIFALLVLGAAVGLPAPPMHVTMDLAPDMEREMLLLCDRIGTAHDPLGTLFSVLSID